MTEKPPVQGPRGQASLAMVLPMTMVAGPIVGYVLALGLSRWLEFGETWDERAKMIGIVLGLMTSARETVRIIKKISKQ